MATDAFVLQPGEGRPIDLGGFLMTVKATADSTDDAFTLLEATEPPGFGPPMHIHRDAAEAFYVHGFRVGDVPSKKLNLYVPQAMVGYFDELAAAIASGNVDDDRLGAIAERYGMEVLGPAPEGYL